MKKLFRNVYTDNIKGAIVCACIKDARRVRRSESDVIGVEEYWLTGRKETVVFLHPA